jgi:predicted ATP-binding protein involved in virulence
MSKAIETTGLNVSLKKLILDDFRGFDHLEIDFDEKLSVFIAGNGGGKTSVLDAIAACLQVYLYQFVRAKYMALPKLSELDIKVGRNELRLTLQIGTLLRYIDTSEIDTINADKILTINASSEKMTPAIDGYDASGRTKHFDFRATYRPKSDSLPVIVYYRSNRLEPTQIGISTAKKDAFYEIYKSALEPNQYSFQSFMDWFDMLYRHHWSEKTTPQALDVVKKAVEDILNETLELNEKPLFKDLRMRYASDQVKGALIIQKRNEKDYDMLDIRQLSSGEQMLMILVADLAKRLVAANPMLANPLEGQGIVLIDEIDLHLHPKWQRTVLPKLIQLFPNIQFVVTTHSIEVLKRIDRKHLRMINSERQISVTTPYIEGRDSNAILWDVFGLSERPSEYEQKLSAFYKLLETDDREAARKILDELKIDWGEMDEEVIRAESYFEIF